MKIMEFSEEEHTIHHDFSVIGAGLGGKFINTRELKALKYIAEMATDKEGLAKVVEEKH